MIRRPRPNAIAAAFVLALTAFPLFAAAPPSLDSSLFSGPGASAETILRVPTVGRYAIVSQGKLGASLELVDRMAGSMATNGRASGMDAVAGRIDSFLEPGEYKIRIGKPQGQAVTLSARAFSVANAGREDFDVPELAKIQSVSGELHDFELLSWWVRIDESDPVLLLEAHGRNLTDAVVWRDGAWDTGIRPLMREFEPEKGMPMMSLEFNVRMDPGLYLVTFAGGPRRSWPKETGKDRFSMTRGGRYLGEMGVMSVTFGESGLASYLVSGNARFFQMESRNNKVYRMAISANSPGASRFDSSSRAEINEKSSSYRATASGGVSDRTQWLTLQGPPGESVEIRWFPTLSGNYPFDSLALRYDRDSRDYLATVLGAAEGEESIDVSGLVVDSTHRDKGVLLEPKGIQVPSLGANHPIRRRLNSLFSVSLAVRVEQAGFYAVVEKDSKAVGAKYAFTLMDDMIAGRGRATPVEVAGGGRIRLQDKLYILTISPVKSGVLDFVIMPTTIVGGGDSARLLAAEPPRPVNGLSWSSIPVLSGSDSTWLIIASRGRVPQGVTVRRLPLDLREPVCVRLEAGASMTLPFVNDAEQLVSSINPTFSGQTARIDGSPWKADGAVLPGRHQLVLSNPTGQEAWHVISAVPRERTSGLEKPKKAELETLFPSFTEGVAVWKSFERGESATFLLKVVQPGPYRIATAGRLAMGIGIRTILKPDLFSASQNADGRNAVVTAYLRPGAYMVRVSAQGASRGRAGMTLERVGTILAGTLSEGVILRKTVPAGSVLKADVRVDRETDYSLECLGLGRSFVWRFEDADAWPLGSPIGNGTLARRLPVGTYHYVSAMDPVPTRRLLSLTARAGQDQAPYDPKAKLLSIRLNRTYRKIWTESQGRPEDVFTLSLPSSIDAILYISQGMLFRVLDEKGQVLDHGRGGEHSEAMLPAGTCRIQVSSIEEDNLKNYSIAVATADLYEGGPRTPGSLPASIPVTVGKDGNIDIWSYGSQEMQAVLVDQSGRIVATAEEIPDDWNFRIVANVKAGRYTLALSSAEDASASSSRGQPVAEEDRHSDSQSEGEYSESEDQGAYDNGEGEYQDGGDEQGSDQGAVSEDEGGGEYRAQDRGGSEAVPELGPAPAGSPMITLISRDTRALSSAGGTLDVTVDLSTEVGAAAFTAKTAGVHRFWAASDEPISVSISRGGRVIASGAAPLFLPLSQGENYSVSFWHSGVGEKQVAFHLTAERPAVISLGGGEISQTVNETVVQLENRDGSSFTVTPAAGRLLYSPGLNLPFRPLTEAAVNTSGATGWVLHADGSPVGGVKISPLALRDGTAGAVVVGSVPQVFSVQVPPRTAALIRTDNAGQEIGLSASPAGSYKADTFDWRGAGVTKLATVIGLRDGSFRGRLWDCGSGQEDRRRAVSARFFPVVSETVLGKSGRLTVSVPSGSAAAVALDGARQALSVSLERGMTAFGWNGRPAGVVDAPEASTSGIMEVQGGSIVVVNDSSAPALCSIVSGAAASQTDLTEAQGFEAVLAGERDLSFSVSADPKSRLFLWGDHGDARYLSEADGRITSGQSVGTDLGPVLVFPGGKGRLEISTAHGALKAWISKPEDLRSSFASKDSWAPGSALSVEGVTLGQAAQSWTFSLDQDAIACLRSDADGVTALYDRSGALLGLAAGLGGRTVISSLPKGSYMAFTRPFRGAGQGGSLRLALLAPTTVAVEGEGAPALLGPGELALYRFEVKAAGKIGAGIRAESDGLSAALFDARFKPIGEGTLFIRKLAPGLYYLLVEAKGETRRFAPVVYGLSGSRTETPDDVIKSYREE